MFPSLSLVTLMILTAMRCIALAAPVRNEGTIEPVYRDLPLQFGATEESTRAHRRGDALSIEPSLRVTGIAGRNILPYVGEVDTRATWPEAPLEDLIGPSLTRRESRDGHAKLKRSVGWGTLATGFGSAITDHTLSHYTNGI
ncbi:hypothetical protein WOLCODRAFT_141124 [Wolfiporia cocos MD-104 SS10]|uniref:Uncharacterized protein n=1 Tax=Wolfiporia cocos (strain MD-104) TaxID=742152 RepID=A0A2H3JC36_WOLCO|nr:hypothetical protein WOLCODRAFT_141124 [Wolfiporia cocos MD-104 SS10]